MINKDSIIKALTELRKQEKRKFSQTVDLIINLKNFDVKRESINLFVNLPYKIKDKKIGAFLTKKSNVVNTITKAEFDNYKGKKIKKLAKNYDFFISIAGLMPAVATSFGKVLGPLGKMPSPQLGMILKEDDKTIQEILEKINKTVRVKSKEPSLKISVGNEIMKDEEIAENILAVYNAVLNVLTRKKENIKSVLIKFTMTKPIKLDIK